MEVKIYLDVLLLVNFVFDYLLLWITGLLLHQQIKADQLCFAALLGAVYAAGVFFLPPMFLYCFPIKFLVGAAMVAMAFRPGCLRTYLKFIAVFFATVFVYSGAAFCLFFLTDLGSLLGVVYKNGSLYVNIPVYLLLLLALGCWVLLKAAFACGAKIAARGKKIIPLKVVYRGKTLHLRGFYDSGNLLYDEISRKSVIIAQWSSAKCLFESYKTPEEAFKAEKNLIAIAYCTISGESFLAAFLPEKIYIEKGKKLIPTETVYIGLVDRTLDYYNNWDAILPHDFEGENHHETKLTPKTVNTFRT
ncbi:MAG: sigma-E processing peptidase SpoIIGA [Clostridia bacterium]|nr:sigma-E processing peptidase SpoIIGA [Clostridia bacterium]